MKFINFLIVKISACMAMGIIVGSNVDINNLIITLLPFLLGVISLIGYWERKKLSQGILFGALVYLLFFFIGWANLQSRLPNFTKNHYSKHSQTEISQLFQIKIKQILKSNPYSNKYIVDIEQLDQTRVSGKLLLSINKDSILTTFSIDDLILISSEILAIKPPLNPQQFNYKKYLSRLGVYHEIKVSYSDILSISRGKTTLRGFAEKLRTELINSLQTTSIGKEQLAIIQALVLGQRDAIDSVRYKQYAAAGAIHILAVSGLHVGVLFAILSWILSPLTRLSKGKIIRSICIIILLWAFAILAGLSPSVVRAVTMFSFFALANMLERPTNTFNTLFLSFLTLLLWEPNWIFHVGFQLSYLAVFFIVWIQPILYKWYQPTNKIKRYLWGLCTVSIAAQLGVAPLSIYYFHQFPGLFMLSNLVILPFLGILLSLGIIVVILSGIKMLPHWLASFYNKLIELLNSFVAWVANQNDFLFEDLSLSRLELIATYLLLIMIARTIQWTSKINLIRLAISALVLISSQIYQKRESQRELLLLFHSSRKSVLAHQHQGNLNIYASRLADPFKDYTVKNYYQGNHLNKGETAKIPNQFQYKGKQILRLDSLGIIPKGKIDILWLTESTRVHLDRLIDSMQPALVIADGSNYTSMVSRWKLTCRDRGVPFHFTREQGFYSFD